MSEGTLLERALRVTPLGSQTRSKAPGAVGPADLSAPFPHFARAGIGPWLTDADGRTYLDFAGANAAIPLGYRPEICEAVAEAMEDGPLLSLPSVLEVEASERLCDLVPCAEMVRWVKTGSEAVSAAVRIARAATGRATVLVARHSYHGWHDWTQARERRAGAPVFQNGVPEALGDFLWPFDYEAGPDTPHGVERVLEVAGASEAGRVAAVVVEPHRLLVDQRGLLLRCKEAARAAGAALIFDEMIYGFRWATAGAQEHFAVVPDLACFGKALGNGVPVACVCGRRALMEHAVPALISSTYGGDRLGLAAADAVMKIHQREDPIGRIWASGAAFWEAYAEAVGPDPALRLAGFPVHFAFDARPGLDLDAVLVDCARQGVLFHRSANNAYAAMTPARAAWAGRVLAGAVRGRET